MCPNCDIILRFNSLPHLDHFLPAVLILPLPLQYFFLLWDDLRKVTKPLKKTKTLNWKKGNSRLRREKTVKQGKDIFVAPPLVQSQASGPGLWAGGDSPLRCSWWSWCTASSWIQPCLRVMTSPCAASRDEQRGGREKETLQTKQSYAYGPSSGPRAHSQQELPEPNQRGRWCSWRLRRSAGTWLDETVFTATVLAK